MKNFLTQKHFSNFIKLSLIEGNVIKVLRKIIF